MNRNSTVYQQVVNNYEFPRGKKLLLVVGEGGGNPPGKNGTTPVNYRGRPGDATEKDL